MNNTAIENLVSWYLINTLPQMEVRARNNLNLLDIEIFDPKIRERRYKRFSNVPTYVTTSLFPRYMFAQFNYADLYHKIKYTRGVCRVVSFGGVPTPIDEEVITQIRSKIKEDGFIRIGEEIRPGDRVIVADGPMKNFAGIFERETKAADRIRILLDTVSYQGHGWVEKDFVKKDSNQTK